MAENQELSPEAAYKALHMAGISTAFHAYHGSDPVDWDIEADNVAIIPSFIPDGPGWCGDVAMVLGGCVSYLTILERNSGADSWRVAHFINEGELAEEPVDAETDPYLSVLDLIGMEEQS